MNLTLEWFRERAARRWHWGRDDLFKFRAQAWALSVSWDRVPVSNLLRDLRRQMAALHRELKRDSEGSGTVTKE
jgi:hypothetical protein